MRQNARGIAATIAVGLIAAAGLGSTAFAEQPLVDKLVLSDTIQPVSAGQLDRPLRRPTRMAHRRCWWSWTHRAGCSTRCAAWLKRFLARGFR